MHDFIYNLGIIGLIIIFFYIVFWLDRRNKPSDYDLVRNHLQRVTHPNLTVKGFGDYHIEYVIRDYHTFEYFKYCSQYEKNLEIMKKDSSIKILKHGLTGYRDWEKWGN
ncbi:MULTISPECIES: hypothetical protein [Acinetobacter]|uniref:hypothetical protein n=1 Tax=Acinetobacter TaxID=469 RepID=UPI000EA16C57|nr:MULTISPECIES: hypothetical protein [Acinetobacter]RKG43798.1 hypothetical protein D7V51_09030 [Acinetobacter cumulans]RZG59513.1 hypothetical protein EXE29_07850 [Acinetobacter sp. WCHAc060006]